MSVTIKPTTTPIGVVNVYTIDNGTGATVSLSEIGAGIVAINVPDNKGDIADVVLGYADIADYISDGPCMGKIPGRYANRIARGVFTLDGKEYKLDCNCGPNHLHGGPTGFANRRWEGKILSDTSVCFTYRSAHGEEGYPGNLTVRATYTWTSVDDTDEAPHADSLTLRIEAETDAPTVANFTNHCYFNLDGEDAPSALDHILWLNADRWLTTDDSLAPTGEMSPVKGTPMDFYTAPHHIRRDITADFEPLRQGKGYDHCWVLNDWVKGTVNQAAVLSSPKSGRRLSVYTSQPAVQVYTGNWLECSSPQSISGGRYADYQGVAIECQGMPDAPNQPTFPSQVLRPGEKLEELIIYDFSTFHTT